MAVQIIFDSLTQFVPSSLTIFYTVACFSVYAIGKALVQRYQFARLCEKVPGPPSQVPFFGISLTQMNVKPEEFMVLFSNWFRIWGNHSMFRIWIGPLPFYVLGSAETVEVVLSSNKIIEKSREYGFLHPWLGTGLLTSTGNKWHQRRKMLTPAFHFKILEEFVTVFNEQSSILVSKLNKKVGEKFDVFPFITLCTLDIICETAMGRNVNAQSQKDAPYVQAVYDISRIVQMRSVRPLLQPDWLFYLSAEGAQQKKALEILHGFTDKVIRERKMEHKLRKAQEMKKGELTKIEDDNFISKKPRLAFLDLLIEASQDGKLLSDIDIREEVDTFMFEGHDTTSAAIAWTLFLLGNNPEAQAKVHDELDRAFGTIQRPITMTDLNELKYLECCIKEALRIYPSVPSIARHLAEDIIIDGNVIPAGSTLNVTPFFIHRDPKHFPDPESYKPERFFSENCQGRHPYAYVPFSAGPRNCIGQKFAMMEEKIMLASILRHFNLVALDKPSEIVLMSDIILRPRDGIRLSITHRTVK